MSLRVGDWVEIRSREEILATLDQHGCLDGLPFMPQMFQWCGQRFPVYKRAHKTCDTVNKTGGRGLTDSVHLDLRCDGQAYGGCQAACLIFWKGAWLRPLAGAAEPVRAPAGCTEEDVRQATRADDRYRCQATQLPEYTTPLAWWDARQYIEDIQSGNRSLRFVLGGIFYFAYRFLIRHSFWRLSVLLRRIYDRLHRIPYPRKPGTVPAGQATPTCTLDLQPGDLVRVKSHDEILATLNAANKNRGLFFDAEMVPFCGGTYRIKARVERFLDERTGQMITLKRGAYMLEGVWCESKYSECRLGCPRSIHSWWREIWLEKLPAASGPEGRPDAGA